MESHTSCSVCHEGIDVYAVGCCDHVICYKCSCRMRVLCEQFYCPICRTDLPQVYLVQDDLKYGDIPRYGYIPNRKNKIFFQNEKVKGLFEKLLENCCQICTHARPERNFKDLQNHMRKEHTLFYCNLCIDHLKLFSSERKHYNRHDLALHRRQGDKDDSSYKGHPLCQFCDERYMDNDELYRHLRKEHFFCHFCDPEGSREFYNDYASLRDHFRNKHFLCQEGACSGQEIRLTHAFRSRIDLQAHTTSEHGNNLTKAQAKQMRTIDIDYQFAPRERRRDRGVVIPADYEDVGQTKVFHNSRGSRGHSGRQRYEESRGFKKGNFSEQDVQKAINASLDVMKEKEKVTVEEQQPEVKEEEKVVRDAENFPVLGNMKQEFADSTVDSDHKDSDSEALDFSMAKQIALKNKRSVQYGRLISEEFPTLSGEPSVKDTATNSSIDLTNKSITSTKSSQPISKKTESVNKPGKKFTTAISKGPVQAEDFPGLPTKSSGPNTALGSASWVSKQTTKKDNKQVSAMPVQVAINTTTTNNNNNKTSKSTNKKVPKTFKDDHDFPSLGGQATASVNIMNWLQKSAVEKSKSKQERKPVDWFEANDKFEFTMDNVKKQSESTEIDNKYTINSDTKKKKKKKEKEKGKTSENTSQNNSKSKGEDTSLDSIASTLLSNKVETEMKQEWNTVDSPKNVRKDESSKIDSPKNDKTEEIKKLDSPQFLRKEGKNSDFVANLIEMDENKFSVLGDDEPDVKYMVEREPVSAPKKKNIEVKLDDFPTLGAANPHKAPPPGFAKPLPSTTVSSTSTNKPPGFDDVSSIKRPPPGFSLPVSSQPNGHSTIAEKQCNFTLKNIMPMMSEASNFDYVPPQDSKSRNQKLIEAIMAYLSKDRDCFDQFKFVSAAFRNGSTSAKEYYSQCEKLIGKEHFDNIFPELLVLLPDIDKQQELLATYKDVQGQTSKSGHVIKISGKSANAPWKQTANFQSCPTCRQVLLSCDISDHTSAHSNASDFPSLSGGGSGPGLRAWVKGN